MTQAKKIKSLKPFVFYPCDGSSSGMGRPGEVLDLKSWHGVYRVFVRQALQATVKIPVTWVEDPTMFETIEE